MPMSSSDKKKVCYQTFVTLLNQQGLINLVPNKAELSRRELHWCFLNQSRKWEGARSIPLFAGKVTQSLRGSGQRQGEIVQW